MEQNTILQIKLNNLEQNLRELEAWVNHSHQMLLDASSENEDILILFIEKELELRIEALTEGE